MNITKVLLFAVFVTALVLVEGILAYKDGLFSVQQMYNRGFRTGVPFVSHGAMWGDLLIVNPIMIVSLLVYGEQWSSKQIMTIGGVMFIASTVLHLLYAISKNPDSLAWNGRLTPAGYLHWLYMGLGLTILGLVYFSTTNTNPTFIIVMSCLLALHIFAGTHMFLNIFRPAWWNKSLTTDWGAILSIFVAWTILGWRCCYLLKH